jgi:CheY-like chemotaxis protein
MSKNAPGVLVIDDDEVVLADIADLLEADFRVRCLTSPVGAVDIAAADAGLVAVILDINMPIMRGDNVARMFLSRARLRDLPLVLISGDSRQLATLHARVPEAKVVAKAEMREKLLTVLKQAIAERARKTARTWGSEPSEVVRLDYTATPVERFLDQLAEEMRLAQEVWQEVRFGNPKRLRQLNAVLRKLQLEADRLAQFQLGRLLGGIEQIVGRLLHGFKLRPLAESAVEKAIEALAAAATPGAQPSSVEERLEALRRAAAELRPSNS